MENKKRFVSLLLIFFVLTGLYVSTLIVYSNSPDLSMKESWSISSADRLVEKSFDVHPGERLTLTSTRGSVKIEGWDRNEVKIRIGIKGRERYLDDIKMSIERTEGGVDVNVDVPSTTRRLWNFSPTLRVEFSVMVPEMYDIGVRTSGGGINLHNINGEIEGRTSGGTVTGTSLSGAITLRTSGGGFRISDVEGDISLRTSGGSIGVENAYGVIDVRTSGGGIRLIDVEGEVSGRTSGGSIRLSYIGENKGINLRTSGGGITVTLPEEISARISARTSGGSVSSDIPVLVDGSVGRSSLEGMINDGGPEINLRTSGGSIRIRSR